MRRSVLMVGILGVVALLVVCVLIVAALAQVLTPLPPAEQTQNAIIHTAEALNATIYGPGGPTGLPPTAILTSWAQTATQRARATAAPHVTGTPSPSATPSPTATPTLDPEELQMTADAFATQHDANSGALTINTDADGLRPRIVFNEAEVDALVAPLAVEIDNVQNVHINLAPEGSTLTADFWVLGIRAGVSATATLGLLNGRLAIEVTSASLGGIGFPQAAIDAVQGQLVELVNRAIGSGLDAYADPETITLTSVEVLDHALAVEFIFAPPPTLTPTPET